VQLAGSLANLGLLWMVLLLLLLQPHLCRWHEQLLLQMSHLLLRRVLSHLRSQYS
jgi:hypothetical protein